METIWQIYCHTRTSD